MNRLIGLEYIPNVLKPGNNVNKESIKELAEEAEPANITTLL